jgi:hypothetical protein
MRMTVAGRRDGSAARMMRRASDALIGMIAVVLQANADHTGVNGAMVNAAELRAASSPAMSAGVRRDIRDVSAGKGKSAPLCASRD